MDNPKGGVERLSQGDRPLERDRRRAIQRRANDDRAATLDERAAHDGINIV